MAARLGVTAQDTAGQDVVAIRCACLRVYIEQCFQVLSTPPPEMLPRDRGPWSGLSARSLGLEPARCRVGGPLLGCSPALRSGITMGLVAACCAAHRGVGLGENRLLIGGFPLRLYLVLLPLPLPGCVLIGLYAGLRSQTTDDEANVRLSRPVSVPRWRRTLQITLLSATGGRREECVIAQACSGRC